MSSLKNSGRESNFELLRIVAMFLVLIVHANFLSLGCPTHCDVIEHPISSLNRYIIQFLALVCVNVYIIISGYFSIRVKAKSILNFIFTVSFWRIFIVCTYVGAVYMGLVQDNYSKTALLKFCIPAYRDWFVAAYVILLFLSPILNAYIEKCSAHQLWLFIVLYFGFQIIFNYLIPIFTAFSGGYSTLSFIGLYILGAAIRKSQDYLLKVKYPMLLYILIAVVVGATKLLMDLYSSYGHLMNRCFTSYNGLFVLAASVSLFLVFKRLSIKSKVINYMAASSFAVYLFHCHPITIRYYMSICKYLFENNDTLSYIFLISCFIIAVFCVAVCIDLIRRWLWNIIWTKILEHHFENYQL